MEDRLQIESLFKCQDLMVVCCTSTLAVGVCALSTKSLSIGEFAGSVGYHPEYHILGQSTEKGIQRNGHIPNDGSSRKKAV